MTVQTGAPRDLGSAWGDWANYVDSPLRAFENELGVQALRNRYSTIRECVMQFGVRMPRVCVVDEMQAPLGYFDPLGLSKDSRQHESLRVKRFTELCLGVLFSTFL